MNLWDHRADEARRTRPKFLALFLGALMLALSWALWPSNIAPFVEAFAPEGALESFGTLDQIRAGAVATFLAWIGWWAVVEGLRGRVVKPGMLPPVSDTTGTGSLAWSRIVQVAPEAVLELRPATREELSVRWRWPFFRDGHHDHVLRFALPFLAGRTGMSTDGFWLESGRVDVPRSWGKVIAQKPIQLGFFGLLVPLSLLRVAAVGGFGDWAVFVLFAVVYWGLLTYEWSRGSSACVRPGVVVSGDRKKEVVFATDEQLSEGPDGELHWELGATATYAWKSAQELEPGTRVVLVRSDDEDDEPGDVLAAADLASHELIPQLLERRISPARWQALESHLQGHSLVPSEALERVRSSRQV